MARIVRPLAPDAARSGPGSGLRLLHVKQTNDSKGDDDDDLVQKTDDARTKPKAKGNDSLDRVRTAAQELHGALSDAAAKRGEAMKADLQSIPPKAKAVAESLKESLGAQSEAIKEHLTEAVRHLEATQKHVADSLKSTGHAFEASVRRAVVEAHASVRQISDAVAAKRTAESTHTHP